MTYSEIIARAKRITHQPSGTDEGWWTDAIWLSILNDKHKEVIDRTQAIMTKATDDCVVDQDYVDVPSTIMTPLSVYVNNKRLQYKDPDKISLVDDGWTDNDSGQPLYWYFLNGKIYFDKPANDTYGVIVFGTLSPTDMSTTQTTPYNGITMFQRFSKVLVVGIVVEMFEDAGETDKLQERYQQYVALIQDMENRIKEMSAMADGVYFDQAPAVYSSEI